MLPALSVLPAEVLSGLYGVIKSSPSVRLKPKSRLLPYSDKNIAVHWALQPPTPATGLSAAEAMNHDVNGAVV